MYGIRSLAINEDTVRDALYDNRDLFRELATGQDVRLAVMSPQMLQSERMQKLIGSQTFKNEVRGVQIDEAHLLDEETGEWRVSYATIKHLRPRLPGAVWAAVTGTATPSRALRIARGLGFQSGHYINARYSVDRPNIKIIPRFLQHPYSGDKFLDLSFLIPRNMERQEDIPLSLVFCETIEEGERVMAYLDSLIPHGIPDRRKLIRLYNSIMPASYRKQCLHDIEETTTLRILVCTDTCTYGLDIQRVRRTVTLGLCPSIEAMVQRINRTARDGLPGEVYTFAPPWVRIIPENLVTTQQEKTDAARRAKLPKVVLDWFNATAALCPRQAYLSYNEEPLEAVPPQCCALHAPEPQASTWRTEIDARIQPGPLSVSSLRTDNTYRTLTPQMKASLTKLLERWRNLQWRKIRGARGNITPAIFMPDVVIRRIVDKAHICSTRDRTRAVIGPQWSYFDECADDLLKYIDHAMKGYTFIILEGKAEQAAKQKARQEAVREPAEAATRKASQGLEDLALEDRNEGSMSGSSRRVHLLLPEQTARRDGIVPDKRPATPVSPIRAAKGKRSRVETGSSVNKENKQ